MSGITKRIGVRTPPLWRGLLYGGRFTRWPSSALLTSILNRTFPLVGRAVTSWCRRRRRSE
jgi:hypothetical protein